MSNSTKFTQGHALIIGVGSDLPNTVQDATGLAAILTDEERCAYPANQVNVLTEAEATRQKVLDALDQLALTVEPDDTVIFYFSGHGYQVHIGAVNMNEYYLMPYEYDQADLPNTTISRPELLEKLNAINAQKQLIILDCCHAGGLDDLEPQTKSIGVSMAKAPISAEAIEELEKGSGRVVISSCRAKELSYAGKPYSQFTQALVEGLAGAEASKQDGFVRANDLGLYAAKEVPKHTRARQNPTMNHYDADNFRVAYYAASDSALKSLPQSAQRQPDPELDSTPTGALTVNLSGSRNTQIVGNNNIVAGERGVAVGGNVGGNIVTGDSARVINADRYVENLESNVFNQKGQTVHGNQQNFGRDINTDGGAFIAGGVSATGDFIGRDKIVKGDEIQGDKIMGDKVDGDKISVGNISGSTGVTIGRGASTTVTQGSAQDLSAIAELFCSVYPTIENPKYPEPIQAVITQQVQAIEEETNNGERADVQKIENALTVIASMAPDILQVVAAALMSPIQGISVAVKKVAERMKN